MNTKYNMIRVHYTKPEFYFADFKVEKGFFATNDFENPKSENETNDWTFE